MYIELRAVARASGNSMASYIRVVLREHLDFIARRDQGHPDLEGLTTPPRED
jgi:hypothetical protein